jgi:hypothetical protein
VVRLRLNVELNRQDSGAIFQQRFDDPMHAVHHPPVCTDEYWIREIRALDKLHVATSMRTVGALPSSPIQ